MKDVREVTHHRDGIHNHWIRVCESHNPERTMRNALDALYRRYVCHDKSITRIVKHYSPTGENHITVYYSNDYKTDFWF